MAKKQASILVVDGSGVSRTLITRILRIEMGNAHITACATAQQALSYLDTGKYDLITTSLLLPDMDGLELCRRIRQGSHRCIPIVVVSGDANDRLLREGFAAGITDYFDKSRGYTEFVEFIKTLTLRNLGSVGRVLYVEDSPTAAEIARRTLERHGLQVLHVSTAEQALELLHQSRMPDAVPFDMVITDYFLRDGMTGGGLLHAIRVQQHYSLQEMPVLVITADGHERKQIELFQTGANDIVIKPLIEEVFMGRVRSLLMVKQQYGALLRQSEEMKHLATTDSLTGVKTKRYLLDNGERLIANADHHPVWAFLIDIDHFKEINDNLGHITGDHVLIKIGALLRQQFSGDTMIVRFGGEEFAVLVPHCTLAEAQDQLENLRRGIEALRPFDIQITASIGAACTADHPSANMTKLLALADSALHAAKGADRNCVYIYTEQGPRRLTAAWGERQPILV